MKRERSPSQSARGWGEDFVYGFAVQAGNEAPRIEMVPHLVRGVWVQSASERQGSVHCLLWGSQRRETQSCGYGAAGLQAPPVANALWLRLRHSKMALPFRLPGAQ
jgi:hypothetical protein